MTVGLVHAFLSPVVPRLAGSYRASGWPGSWESETPVSISPLRRDFKDVPAVARVTRFAPVMFDRLG
jgi:hypothetical protein